MQGNVRAWKKVEKREKKDALCVLELNMLPRTLARKAFLVKILTDVTTEHFAPMKEIN